MRSSRWCLLMTTLIGRWRLYFRCLRLFCFFLSYHLLLCRHSLIIQLVVVERLSGHPDNFSVSTFETKNPWKKLRAHKRDHNNYTNADKYIRMYAHKTHENRRDVSPLVALSFPSCTLMLSLWLFRSLSPFSTFAADIYDKVQEELEAVGFDTECLGGGRILHDPSKRSIQVYGYSQVCYQLTFIIFNDPHVPRLELESLTNRLLYNPPTLVKQIIPLLGKERRIRRRFIFFSASVSFALNSFHLPLTSSTVSLITG